MDISEKYIKMCEKAGEIQKQLQRHTDENGCRYVSTIDNTLKYSKENKKLVWLPRQDQLQEMLGWGCGALLNELYEFAILDKGCEIFDSLEQFWLAFVMHEKYGKVWDDKKGEWGE